MDWTPGPPPTTQSVYWYQFQTASGGQLKRLSDGTGVWTQAKSLPRPIRCLGVVAHRRLPIG